MADPRPCTSCILTIAQPGCAPFAVEAHTSAANARRAAFLKRCQAQDLEFRLIPIDPNAPDYLQSELVNATGHCVPEKCGTIHAGDRFALTPAAEQALRDLEEGVDQREPEHEEVSACP